MLDYGRELCGDVAVASRREWLVTNGLGGYAMGTVAGMLSRSYHGLLIAAMAPPGVAGLPPAARTLLLAKLDETVVYDGRRYVLFTDQRADEPSASDPWVTPKGYRQQERFHLEGTTPVWSYAVADARLEKRIWMEPGANTTYVQYTLTHASRPLTMQLAALATYRDHHATVVQTGTFPFQVDAVPHGLRLAALGASPFYLLSDRAQAAAAAEPLWLAGYHLAVERYRGQKDLESYCHVADFAVTLHAGETVTFVASTEAAPDLEGAAAWARRQAYEQGLLEMALPGLRLEAAADGPAWLAGAVRHLALAADQFVVRRELARSETGQSGEGSGLARSETGQSDEQGMGTGQSGEGSGLARSETGQSNEQGAGTGQSGEKGAGTGQSGEKGAGTGQSGLEGKSIIAGYPWFGDWGRDTMIALPGLTLDTGRAPVARQILLTFARSLDQGMLPNRFPDAGETPEYNTIDATLWYFEAIRAYHAATGDDGLLAELYPVLQEIVAWHRRGTRYHIRLDPADGLLYGGSPEVQLTWMDAKLDDWVVTPRIGKPVEISALWYNGLRSLASFARRLGHAADAAGYDALAEQTLAGFQRFWSDELGYCYDVLDGPDGDDPALRPNQLFAVSLHHSPLNAAQAAAVVDVCARHLLTSHGLRSLAPDHPEYIGVYGGNRHTRDAAYHQGTTWGWLLGPFVSAHYRVHRDPAAARAFLIPMLQHLHSHGVGSLSEVFDGDPPFTPRACPAQAWSVGEVLRVWRQVAG